MSLPTSTPSAQGVDARGILSFLDGVAHLDVHSLAIARRGHAIARGWWAPYSADRKHLVYSCTKSMTASTVASLTADGLFELDDPILQHLPPQAVAGAGDLDPIWQRVTLRHCLTMTIGHTEEAWPGSFAAEPLHTILANPPQAEPGTVFAYNQVCTYLLSRAVEHRTGHRLGEAAQDLLDAIGCGEPDWETDHAGHHLGFTGMRITTDDLLTLAQLWLDDGVTTALGSPYQALPQGWVAQASQPFLPVDSDSASDWEHGYGQSFWVARHGFRGDGAYGQYAVVLPEHEVVVVATTEMENMQEFLDLLWDHLLPALDRPGDPGADLELAQRLATLQIQPLASTVEPGATIALEVNPYSTLGPAYTAVEITPIHAATTLTLVRSGERHDIAVGDGQWLESEIVADGKHLPVVASGGWTPDGFVAQVRVIETPHQFTVTAAQNSALLQWRLAPLRSADPMMQAVR